MPPSAKKAYYQQIEIRLKNLKTRIVVLEKQVEKKEADIQVRHDQKMSQIRGHYAQTKEKLDELQDSTQEAWLELRSVLDEAIQTLEEAVDVMTHHFSAQTEEQDLRKNTEDDRNV